MKKIIAKLLSIITVVPIMAILAMAIMYIFKPELFDNEIKYMLMPMLFLGIIPILAYPVARIVPYIHKKGRDGERNLAFIFTLAGYAMGIIYAIIARPPHAVAIILTSYFITAVMLTIVNKVVKVKASGHACGLAGPIVLLVYFVSPICLALFTLMPIVFWARSAIGRHTLSELAVGTAVGIASPLVSILLYMFFI